MKRLFTIASVFLAAGAMAQTPNWGDIKKAPFEGVADYPLAKAADAPKTTQHASQRAEGALLWSEDFGGGLPINWTTSANALWKHTFQGSQGQYGIPSSQTAAPVIASPTAANGFLIFDADSANTPTPGGGFQTYNGSVTTSAISGLSGNQNVVLSFHSFFRLFTDAELKVMVSKTPNFASFTEFDMRHGVATNVASDNAIFEKVYLNASDPNIGTGGFISDPIYIRWSWTSGSHYFWQVDDVEIREVPDYDIQMVEDYYLGADTANTEFYTMVPLRQSENADTLALAAATIINLGGAQTNVTTKATIYDDGGIPVSTVTSAPLANMATSQMDTVNIGPVEGPDALGTYEMEFEVYTAFNDDYPLDNVKSTVFDVTETTYAWDHDDSNPGGVAYDPAQSPKVALGLRYELFAPDTVTGIEVYLYSDADQPFGTQVGDYINISLWNLDNDFELIERKSFIQMTASTLNQWVTFSFDEPVGLPAGNYVAAVESAVDGQELGVGQEFYQVWQPHTVFGTSDWAAAQSGQDWFYTTTLVYVRMRTKSQTACQGVDIAASGTTTISYNVDSTEATLDVSISGPQSGTSPYNYVWSGGTSGASANERMVDANDVYTVTVADANFCSGTFTFDVQDIKDPSGIAEAANALNWTIYPNPNNGQFILSLNNTGSFNVTVSNLLGETVYTDNILSQGEKQSSINLEGVSKGVYIVRVSDGSSESTQRLIVK